MVKKKQKVGINAIVIVVVALAVALGGVFYLVQQGPSPLAVFTPDYMITREYVLPTGEVHTVKFGDYEVIIEYGGEQYTYRHPHPTCYITYSILITKNEEELFNKELSTQPHQEEVGDCTIMNAVTYHLDYINEADHLTLEIIPTNLLLNYTVITYGYDWYYYHCDDFKLTVTYPVNGDIQITSDPSDAQVFMDVRETLFGTPEEIYLGNTPLTVRDILIGSHTIRVHKTGYDDYYTNVVVQEEGTAMVHAVMLGVAPQPVIPVMPICVDGEFTCMGDSRMKCIENGTQWITVEVCAFGCDPLLNKCKELQIICSSGDKVCSGNTLLECNAFGTGYGVKEYCQYGCFAGECIGEEEEETEFMTVVAAIAVAAGLLIAIYLMLTQRRNRRG